MVERIFIHLENTITLLKNMLTTLSIGDIPFAAENIFCLDNEAFRYLVALQNRIPFSDHEKQEFGNELDNINN